MRIIVIYYICVLVHYAYANAPYNYITFRDGRGITDY